MEINQYLQLGQEAINTAVFVSLPVLGLGLIAGIFVSIFQAATQISDASLAFIPKIGAAVVAMLVFGNFMITTIAQFTIGLWSQIPSFIK